MIYQALDKRVRFILGAYLVCSTVLPSPKCTAAELPSSLPIANHVVVVAATLAPIAGEDLRRTKERALRGDGHAAHRLSAHYFALSESEAARYWFDIAIENRDVDALERNSGSVSRSR
jgi:hypothetical protein